MSARFGDIILPWNVRHALRLLSQSSAGQVPSDKIVTDVMKAWLANEHADVWEFVQQQEQREQDMVKQLAAQQLVPAKKGKSAA